MQKTETNNQDELDLSECVRVIIKRKILLYAFIFLGILVAFFIIITEPRLYKSSLLIRIKPSISVGAIKIEDYIEFLKSNLILEKIVEKYNSNNIKGQEIKFANLDSNLNFNKTNSENIFQLNALDINPIKAKNIVDIWAATYIDYSQGEFVEKFISKSKYRSYIENIYKNNLLKAKILLINFKRNCNLDSLKSQLLIYQKNIQDCKNELIVIDLDLETKVFNLSEIKKELVSQNKFIILERALIDSSFQKDELKKFPSLSNNMVKSQELNPIYQDLSSRYINEKIELNTIRARKGYLEKAIEKFENALKDLQEEIWKKDVEYEDLLNRIQNAKTEYSNFLIKEKEIEINRDFQFGEVEVISFSNLPDRPINNNSKKKLFLGFFFGTIIGFFMVFIVEFWQKSINREYK